MLSFQRKYLLKPQQYRWTKVNFKNLPPFQKIILIQPKVGFQAPNLKIGVQGANNHITIEILSYKVNYESWKGIRF